VNICSWDFLSTQSGEARRGKVGQGVVSLGVAWHGEVSISNYVAGCGMARRVEVSQGLVRSGLVRLASAIIWHGTAWCGVARRDTAWQGKVGLGFFLGECHEAS
jgi:hypothetical protein